MAKDYSYLEGKTFQFYNGHETVTAKVAAADYHVGITCVNAADPDDYLICFHGPASPRYIKQNVKIHQYSWLALVRGIEKGYVDGEKLVKTVSKYTQKYADQQIVGKSFMSADACVFNQ